MLFLLDTHFINILFYFSLSSHYSLSSLFSPLVNYLLTPLLCLTYYTAFYVIGHWPYYAFFKSAYINDKVMMKVITVMIIMIRIMTVIINWIRIMMILTIIVVL